MSDLPDVTVLPKDMTSFISSFADLQPWQRQFIETLTRVDFAEMEKRLISAQIRPKGKSIMERLFVACDWADGFDYTAVMMSTITDGGVLCIIDDISDGQLNPVAIKRLSEIYRDTPPTQTRSTPYREDGYFGDKLLDMKIGRIDGFRFIESPIKAVEPLPEPRARNGARANRKTQQAKAKLPFYHKNRRF
ncbi:hypothetical protein [Paraburkholderia sp. SIMBA_054]|uniref:hypothetical protein n=1 Tax=Paraburkholderia sp. SIMBA_054 TaxID=3085795 RepID=UPI00397CDA93